MSYKILVRVGNSGKYYPNGVAFPTREEAEERARVQAMAWTVVQDWRVVKSDEPANYRWIGNQLVEIKR